MSKTAEIVEQIENKLIRYSTEESDEYYAWVQGIRDGVEYAAQFAASPQPDAGGEIEKIKQTFENIIKWCEESGIKDCDISNKQHMAIYHSLHLSRNALATLPTREPEVKEKFAIRFSEWLMIQCDYKNHCVWEYQGEEYTQQELIEIFKHTTPSRPANKSVNN
jgi:hypothetical protein